MKEDLLHISFAGTPCSECKAHSFPLVPDNLYQYFLGNKIECPKCGAKLDWWKLLLRHLEWENPFYIYGLVGGLQSSFRIKMRPNQIFNLDLTKLGIPEDAKILQINYTPNGEGLFPVELHGNIPIRHFIPHKINLFGRPFGNPQPETPVAVGVSWVYNKNQDESWNNLVQAIEAFSKRQYESAIIPANVAVEAKLIKVLRNYMIKYAASKRVDELLETRATYSYQLNVLLPMIIDKSTFPKLPDLIRGNLNTLRIYRNDLAHRGIIDIKLNKDNTSALICASVFGLGYANYLEKYLGNAG